MHLRNPSVESLQKEGDFDGIKDIAYAKTSAQEEIWTCSYKENRLY